MSDALLRNSSADSPLTSRQRRALQRQIADLDDPVRYFLVSRFSPRFALYYDAAEDVYVMNDPAGATLFKRRSAAEAVRKLLGKRVQTIRCSTRMRNGKRVPVVSSLPQGLKQASRARSRNRLAG